MPKDEVLIAMERKRYHERLLQTGTLAINAFPPPVAQAVGIEIRRCLENAER